LLRPAEPAYVIELSGVRDVRGYAAFLALGLMSASAASATDVAGWYAGIYAGSAQRNGAAISTAVGSGGFNSSGTVAQPGVIRHSPGLDEGTLAFANLFLLLMPYSSSAAVDVEFHDGAVGFDPTLKLDVTLGYGLGNGWRIDAGYSQASFEAASMELDPGYSDFTYGSYLSNGDWFWLMLPFGGPSAEPGRTGTPLAVLEVESLTTRAEFFLVSGWYDFDTGGPVTPYLGGGFGMARLSAAAIVDCPCVDRNAVSDPAFVPAAQLGAGVRVKLAEPVSLDIGYRYRAAASADLGLLHGGSDGLLPRITALAQTGPIGIHAVSAGLTFALD
jgi:opacity protein-like surface antigen